MTTILHIEPDLVLAGVAKDAFEAFGFHGDYLIAASIRDAHNILTEASNDDPVDLIISDMELPDGSGLDMVRTIRADPTYAHVPIVMLSGDCDPATVDRAYVLGVNAYVSKRTRRRSLSDTMRALYAHWLEDGRLPSPTVTTRTRRYIAFAIDNLMRKATIYMTIADHLGPEDGELWMNLALRAGNMCNLLTFLSAQLDNHELPRELLDRAEAQQAKTRRQLDELEQQPVRTPGDAERYIRSVAGNVHVGVLDRVLAGLFPNSSMAITAFREIAANTLEEIAGWVAHHAIDPELRGHIANLRDEAARIRTSEVEPDVTDASEEEAFSGRSH
jgi:CheY-like chemotaxis protein